MEEMCILVDENDKKIGFDTKKNCKVSNMYCLVSGIRFNANEDWFCTLSCL